MLRVTSILATVLFSLLLGALSANNVALASGGSSCSADGCKVFLYLHPAPVCVDVIVIGTATDGVCGCPEGYCAIQSASCQFNGTLTVVGGPLEFIEIGSASGNGTVSVAVDTGAPGCSTASATHLVKVWKTLLKLEMSCVFDMRVECSSCVGLYCDSEQ